MLVSEELTLWKWAGNTNNGTTLSVARNWVEDPGGVTLTMQVGPIRGFTRGTITGAPQSVPDDYPLKTNIFTVHGLLLLPILE